MGRVCWKWKRNYERQVKVDKIQIYYLVVNCVNAVFILKKLIMSPKDGIMMLLLTVAFALPTAGRLFHAW